jgi:hypothetical protein
MLLSYTGLQSLDVDLYYPFGKFLNEYEWVF